MAGREGITFIHTADWQVGAASTQAGHKAGILRGKRMAAIASIAEAARNCRADFIIVAGDMFEDHDIDELLIRQTVNILNSVAPVPVFIIPGNHDYAQAGGIWDRRGWKGAGEHIRLLLRREEVSVDDRTAIYPCPVSQKRSSADPTAWIEPRREGDGRFRIGIAHGSLDIAGRTVNFPIAPDRPDAAGLDYLALGDWHGMRIAGRAAYPGTPEQTSFGEHDTGHILKVTLERGAAPLIEGIRVGTVKWLTFEPAIGEMSDVEHLERSIEAAGDGGSLLVRVKPTIRGDVTGEVLAQLSALRSRLLVELLYLDWPAESIAIPPDTGEGPEPSGILADVDRMLSSYGKEQSALLQHYSAEEAAEARALLREYLRGGVR